MVTPGRKIMESTRDKQKSGTTFVLQRKDKEFANLSADQSVLNTLYGSTEVSIPSQPKHKVASTCRIKKVVICYALLIAAELRHEGGVWTNNSKYTIDIGTFNACLNNSQTKGRRSNVLGNPYASQARTYVGQAVTVKR